MYYKSVLQSYVPIETGDFMRKYAINGREFVIYSPEAKYISCLDLYSFRDITPIQLALCIDNPCREESEEEEEFAITKVCSPNDLINFLFDIQPKKGDLYIRRQSGFQGYLLNDIQRPFNKVRNFFQFNLETKEYSLLFNNELCYKCSASIVPDTDHIDICWDPYSYYLLNESMCRYLLPSSNPVLLSFIYGLIRKGKPGIEIELHVCRSSLHALRFVSLYLKIHKIARGFEITYENGCIIVQFDNWSPIDVMNFISKLQRICNLVLYEEYSIEESVHIFQNYSHCGISYVVFPQVELYAKEFLKMIMKELKLDQILCRFN